MSDPPTAQPCGSTAYLRLTLLHVGAFVVYPARISHSTYTHSVSALPLSCPLFQGDAAVGGPSATLPGLEAGVPLWKDVLWLDPAQQLRFLC